MDSGPVRPAHDGTTVNWVARRRLGMVSPYDHLQATEAADVPPGVYRVVGAGEDCVTLLCVTDADGRRANTGHVERVDRETVDRAFDPAENPDSGLDPIGAVTGVAKGLYWSVRGLF